MSFMAKKREDRAKGKKHEQFSGDLDGGFVSPLRSIRDLSASNIRTALAGSRYLQTLFGLTVIGAFLRLYNIGFNSLWLDEATTYNISINTIAGIWQTMVSGEFNPPLFYWIEHVMLMFGNNETILRLVPAVAGILTIPLVYLVASEFLDRNLGIISAAAFTFSPFLLYYSQEARAYSLMMFFVAFAMVFYLKAMKSGNLHEWALFGVLSALAFWAHFYALVIIGALILYALAIQLIDLKKNLASVKMILAGIAVFVVLSLPLIIVTIQLFARRTAGGPTFGSQGLELIYQTFLQFAGSLDIVMYILVILFIAGIIQAFLIDRNKGIFLATLTILTFLISFVLSYKIPMVPRYLIFFDIVFVIGIAFTYKAAIALFNSKTIIYGFLIFFFVISLPGLASYYSGFTKDDWRGFALGMHQEAKPGDYIVLVPGYISQPFDYYYTNSSAGTFEFLATNSTELNAINSIKANNSVYFIVTGDIYSADPSGNALQWLKENTRAVGSDTGIALFVSTTH